MASHDSGDLMYVMGTAHVSFMCICPFVSCPSQSAPGLRTCKEGAGHLVPCPKMRLPIGHGNYNNNCRRWGPCSLQKPMHAHVLRKTSTCAKC
eukprot:scaffold248626_cov19-Tisochrysis_lutea.AAC.1